jgi:formylglycine-generating enzyme required for sulfatase activity
VVVTEAGGFEMVLVKPGSFQMGSVTGRSVEQPVHTVSITRPFYVSKYAITFDQYDEFHEETRSGSPLPDDDGRGRGTQPVVRVTWYDAVAYCNWLSERAGLIPCYSGRGITTKCDFSANGYRLPTEAEWEYAARGGHRSQGFTYAGSDNVDEVGWYLNNSGGERQPVGQKRPNELGLYDMSGNVWEFCWDWYGLDYYESSPASDPAGIGIPGPYERKRSRRGGAWEEPADSLRIAFRSHDWPDFVDDCNGFRVVRTAQNI